MFPPFLTRLAELPESWEWIRFFAAFFGLGAVVGFGELIRRRAGWPPEVTRKFVHIGVGTLTFFAPAFFDHAFLPLLLALLFIIIDAVAIRSGLLKGMHGTNRFSYGTVYFPLSFLVLIILFWYRYPPFLSLSMVSLTFGDAAAAIVGESLRSPHEYRLTSDKKSLEGSAAMFGVTFLGLAAGMWILDFQELRGPGFALLAAAVAAAVATAWEALSSKGFDNFTVPMSVAFVLVYFFVPTPMQDVPRFLTGMALGALIAILSRRMRFLTAGGSMATALLATLIFGLGGWKWTIPILAFFVLSSLLSKAGKEAKRSFEGIAEKTGARDHSQVAANGGIAGLLILAQFALDGVDLYPLYLGTLAAVTADTWGTEIGVWVRGRTVTFPFFRRVEPGVNGGVSLAGFFGGVAGSACIALSAWPWIETPSLAGYIVLAGVMGALADSLLGATVQAGMQCSSCGKKTEQRWHCGVEATHVSGIRWIGNDAVNWVCAAAGALALGLLL